MPRRFAPLGRNLVLDGDVPAADEERGDRFDLRIEPGRDAPLDAAQVGLGRGQILLAREQQRHVDRHAGEDRGLDRLHAGRRPRDLDVEIGPVRRRVQFESGGRGLGGVVDDRRRDLERDEAVGTVGRVEDRAEQVGGAAQVAQCELEEQVLAGTAFARKLGDLVVVEIAGADGLLEDGRVRGQAGDRELVDVALQAAVAEHLAGDVVDPHALAEGVQLLQIGIHGFSFVAAPSSCSSRVSSRSPIRSTVRSAAG